MMAENVVEKNIRVLLKDICNLYSDADLGITDLIFTTFDFDLEFFEEHIITFLMGSDKKISTIGELNETNHWINKHGVSVYYDQRSLLSGDSCITLPVYPKQILKGVFHPKVIVVHGFLKENRQQATHLIVSSCNLTISGYGRNKEAFCCIKVGSQNVANSLLAFLNVLSDNDSQRHKTVRDYLRNTNFPKRDDIEFFWNLEPEQHKLLDTISKLPKGDLQVISPYFDEEGPKRLLDIINDKEKVTLLPALDRENYNIHKKDYEQLKTVGVEFKTLAGDGQNNRLAHAKIIVKGQYLIVGSYNFTTAALEGYNAEAALIFRKKLMPTFVTMPIEENRFLPDGKPLQEGDTLNKSNDNVFVSVTIDWQANKISVQSRVTDTKADYLIKFDGVKNGTGWSLKTDGNELEIELTEELSRGFLRHKQFAVFKNNILCFKGLVNEINWVDIRPELGCESLDETLAEWYMYAEGKAKGCSRAELKYISDDDATTEKIVSGNIGSQADIFDNYYVVSKALGNLIQQVKDNCQKLMVVDTSKRMCARRREFLAAREHAWKALYSILVSAPGSVQQILNHLEKKEQEEDFDVVFGFLICKYLERALDCMSKVPVATPLIKTVYKKTKSRVNAVKTRLYEKLIAAGNSQKYLSWIENELFKSEI